MAYYGDPNAYMPGVDYPTAPPVLPSRRANDPRWQMQGSVQADVIPDSPTTTTAGSTRERLMRSILSPEGVAAIAMGGLGVGQAMLTNRANAAEGDKNRAFQRQQLLSQIAGDQMDDTRARQQGYMNTFAMDPVAQQRALFSASLLRDVAQNGPARVAPGQGVTNPVSVGSDTMGFLSPDALAENASRFYGAAGALGGPGVQHPDLAAMGFGAAGASRQAGMDQTITQANDRYEQMNRERRDTLMNGFAPGEHNPTEPPGNPDPSRYVWDAARKTWTPMKKQGGGFLGVLGKIAPFAAMAIPFAGPALGMTAMAANGLATGVGVAGALANRNPMGAAQYGAGFGQDYFNRRGGR